MIEVHSYAESSFAGYNEMLPLIRYKGGTCGGGSEALIMFVKREDEPKVEYPKVINSSGNLIAATLDASYWKGQEQGMEKSENLSASEPKYRLRRLTPTECLRLQGYADDWCDLEPIQDLTDEEIEFWEENRRYRAEMEGKRYKPIGKQGLIKWLNRLGSDSEIYKAAGNSLAIPCAADVLGRIVRFVEQEEKQGESQK